MREVIEFLIEGRHKQLETLTNGIRLTADEMANAIGDYGRQLIMPPDEGFDLMDVIQIRDSLPVQWSITMPLWTKEQGRSDLTLELTIVGDDERLCIGLDDIHVL